MSGHVVSVFSVSERARLERIVVELRWRAVLSDPKQFFDWCVRIDDPKSADGLQPFCLYDYQEGLLGTLESSRFVALLKARQLGLTTLMAAYALWTSMSAGRRVLYVSRNQDEANKALQMMRQMFLNLPGWAASRAPRLVVDKVDELQFEHPSGVRSSVVSLAATKKVGAGSTVDLVVADEFALYDFQGDALKTLLPTVQVRRGRLVLFSTARGSHNVFARTYRAAKQGVSQFVPVFIPWFKSRTMLQADYDAEAATHRENGEPWLVHSEYPASDEEAFRETGRPRFVGLPAAEEFEEFPHRGRLTLQGARGWEFVVDEGGPLRMADVALPSDVNEWVLSVDTSKGVGGDWTAAVLFAKDPDGVPRVWAYWHADDVSEADAAGPLGALGRMAVDRLGRPALIVVETVSGNGSTLVNELHRHQRYSRLYRHRVPGHRRQKVRDTIGFPTTRQSRPQVIDALASLLNFERPATTLRGIFPELRSELGTFVRRQTAAGLREEADVGCHDDIVMACAIGCWVLGEQVSSSSASGFATATPVDDVQDGNHLHHALVVVPQMARQEAELQAFERQMEIADDWLDSQLESGTLTW